MFHKKGKKSNEQCKYSNEMGVISQLTLLDPAARAATLLSSSVSFAIPINMTEQILSSSQMHSSLDVEHIDCSSAAVVVREVNESKDTGAGEACQITRSKVRAGSL
jgi:hypothetical protein